MGAISEHFSDKELACHHCGVNECTQPLVDGLEELRTVIGRPVIVDDAYRCPVHNAEVGGVAHSQHELGNAADIRVEGMTARQLYAAAAKIPAFHGFGVSEGDYIHVDVRETPAKWCYDASGREIAWRDAETRAA